MGVDSKIQPNTLTQMKKKLRTKKKTGKTTFLNYIKTSNAYTISYFVSFIQRHNKEIDVNEIM